MPPPPLLLSPLLPLALCVLLLPLHSSSSCLSPFCFFLLLQDSSDPLYDCTLTSPSPSPHIGDIQSPFECPQLLEHGFWWDRMCFEYTGLALCRSLRRLLSLPFPTAVVFLRITKCKGWTDILVSFPCSSIPHMSSARLFRVQI